MLRSKIVVVISFLALVVAMSFCKKEAGPGGKNNISGNVVYKNGDTGNNTAAPMAKIYIAYGTDQGTSTFGQTILADNNGNYIIEGLNKGKYFIKAEYTDAHGFNYRTQGYGVIFENKKKNLEVNIVLE